MVHTFVDENGEVNEWNGKSYPLGHTAKVNKMTKEDLEAWERIAEEDEERFYSEHPDLRRNESDFNSSLNDLDDKW